MYRAVGPRVGRMSVSPSGGCTGKLQPQSARLFHQVLVFSLVLTVTVIRSTVVHTQIPRTRSHASHRYTNAQMRAHCTTNVNQGLPYAYRGSCFSGHRIGNERENTKSSFVALVHASFEIFRKVILWRNKLSCLSRTMRKISFFFSVHIKLILSFLSSSLVARVSEYFRSHCLSLPMRIVRSFRE